MEINHQKILKDFISHLDKYIALLEKGSSSTIDIPDDLDVKQIYRIFLRRFRSNLYALLSLEDPLIFALLQRYNHEMLLDFYFLCSDKDEEKRAKNFKKFSSFPKEIPEEIKSKKWKKWGGYDTSYKEIFMPPWTGSQDSFENIYKHLSNLAHSNILSITLNVLDNDAKRSRKVITEAIFLCIFEIATCLDYYGFRIILGPNDLNDDLYSANLDFQHQAGLMLISD